MDFFSVGFVWKSILENMVSKFTSGKTNKFDYDTTIDILRGI